MLIVVINPVAVAPVFVSVTRGMDAAERRAVLNRAVFNGITGYYEWLTARTVPRR
jgi:small neutral amino acid transporter SnatA (MarC family)